MNELGQLKSQLAAVTKERDYNLERWKHAEECYQVADSACNEKIKLLAGLEAKCEQMRQAVQVNHKWHEIHDDYGGYAESELQEQNLKALSTAPAPAMVLASDIQSALVVNGKMLLDYLIDQFPSVKGHQPVYDACHKLESLTKGATK